MSDPPLPPGRLDYLKSVLGAKIVPCGKQLELCLIMKGRQEVRLPKISSRRENRSLWKTVGAMFHNEGSHRGQPTDSFGAFRRQREFFGKNLPPTCYLKFERFSLAIGPARADPEQGVFRDLAQGAQRERASILRCVFRQWQGRFTTVRRFFL